MGYRVVGLETQVKARLGEKSPPVMFSCCVPHLPALVGCGEGMAELCLKGRPGLECVPGELASLETASRTGHLLK